MKNTVTIHKEFNRSAIPFYKEIAINFFSIIMKKWNNEEEYSHLIFTKKEIKDILNLSNLDYLKDFLLGFTKDMVSEFKIGEKNVTGSAFYFVTYDNKDSVEVHLHEELRPYLFTQRDINYCKTRKQNKLLNYDDSLEKKRKQLMIFSQTDLFNFKSKYTKRLYMLLIQFTQSGNFAMLMGNFKNVMEIPNSYKQSHIDARILKPAIDELKKVYINIIKIEKIKKGRFIHKIKIKFKYNPPKKEIGDIAPNPNQPSEYDHDKAREGLLKVKKDLQEKKLLK